MQSKKISGEKLLSPKQAAALRILLTGDRLELLYGGAAGGGKTWLGCFWVWYLCRKYPGVKIVIARRHLKDLESTTLPSFYKVCVAMEGHADYKAEKFWAYNGQKAKIAHKRNGSEIHFVDTDYRPQDPLFDRYGGQEYTCGWCEEVQETSRKAYNALRSRLNRHLNEEYNLKPMMLSTCNPSKGWIYTDFYLPQKEGRMPPGRAFMAATIDDNPFLPTGYKELLLDMNDPLMKARLVEGQWEFDDDENQLLSANVLANTLSAIPRPGNVRIGIDVALDGPRADKTVLAIVSGNALQKIETIAAADYSGDPALFDLWLTRTIFERIKPYNICNPNAVRIDYSGVGANIWQLLRANFGLLCYPFKGGSAPIGRPGKMQKFENIRAQAWWEMKEKARLKQFCLPGSYDEELWQELTAVHYSIRGDTIKLEDKHYLRHRLGRSPDKADAFVMALFDIPENTTGGSKIVIK